MKKEKKNENVHLTNLSNHVFEKSALSATDTEHEPAQDTNIAVDKL